MVPIAKPPLSKAYELYVVEGGRLITQPKNFIWKPKAVLHSLADPSFFIFMDLHIGLKLKPGLSEGPLKLKVEVQILIINSNIIVSIAAGDKQWSNLN